MSWLAVSLLLLRELIDSLVGDASHWKASSTIFDIWMTVVVALDATKHLPFFLALSGSCLRLISINRQPEAEEKSWSCQLHDPVVKKRGTRAETEST